MSATNLEQRDRLVDSVECRIAVVLGGEPSTGAYLSDSDNFQHEDVARRGRRRRAPAGRTHRRRDLVEPATQQEAPP